MLESELQVIDIANCWISVNLELRQRHAKDLMLKCKLTLLSLNDIRSILDNYSYFKGNPECVTIILSLIDDNHHKCVLENKTETYLNIRRCSY